MCIAFWIVRRKYIFPYVYITVFSLEYLNPDFLGQFFTIGKVLPIPLLGAYLLNVKGNLGLRSYRLFKPLLILSLYFIVSLLWTPDFLFGVQRGASFILLLISFWFVAHFTQDENGLRHFIGAFVLLSIILSIISILYFIKNLGGGTLIRAGVFGLNSHGASILINLGTFPLIIGVLLKQHKGWKWLNTKWYFFVILLNIIGLLSTASKTGIIVLILGSLLLFIMVSKYQRRLKILAGGIIILLFLFYVNIHYPFISNFFSRFDTITMNDSNDYFSRFAPTRAMIWGELWENFLKHPVFGIGLRSSIAVSSLKAPPHNSFLWALVEGGIIGGIILIILCSSISFIIIKARRIARYKKDINLEFKTIILLFMLVIFFLYSLTLDIIFNKFLWIVLAMTESLWSLVKSKMFCKKGQATTISG